MSGIVRFDLNRGRVTLRDASGQSDERSGRVLIPVDVLSALLAQVSSAGVSDLGYRVGTEIGRRVRDQLGSDLDHATPHTVLDYLGGELALLGLGSFKLELWGRVMVFAVNESPLLEATPGGDGDRASSFLAALLEGALARAASRDAKVLPLARASAEVRLLVCNAAAREQVAGWLSSGCHYGEALARLNQTGVGT